MISKAARRYSLALYSLAEEKSSIEQVVNDFSSINSLLSGNRELQLFFHSPAVSRQKKLNIVKEIFEGNLNQLSYNFLRLLVTRGRESLTGDIVEDFLNLRKEKAGIINVSVSSAIELSDEDKAMLTKKIDGYTGKKSEFKYKTDPLLIGGFVAKIGDTVLDASVRRQLDLLKEKFRSGEYRAN